jgi:site-specific recombinase XerD
MKNRHIPNNPLFFSMTFEFLMNYMSKQLGRSEKTIESYRDSLTIFRCYLYRKRKISIGKFLFEDCSARLIQDFIIFLKESGNSPNTCNQRLSAIKTYLWFAADRDITLQSIALTVSRIPQCKVPKTEKKILSDKAVNHILLQPKNTKIGMRDRVMMILLYDSAIRLDELLSLTLQDLVLERNNPYIRVNGKGNKERIVAISPKTVEHLNLYLKVFHTNGNRNDLIFYTKIKGQIGKMSEGNVERFIAQYADRARASCKEIPLRVHPHMFRRTRATQMYRNGVELALISCLLGHSCIETTKVYATASLEMLRTAMEAVETPEQLKEKPLWKECSEEEMAKLCGLR